MIKGIIFDLDGTTIHTLPDLQESLNKALKEYGFPERTYDQVRLGIGNGYRKLIDSAVPEEIPEEIKVSLAERYKQIYSENYANHSYPYEGMKEVLQQMQEKGIKLAVNSNKSTENTNRLITKNFPGINFVAVIGARKDIPLKPDPYTANEIIEMMGLKKEEVFYVGDSDVDMHTGHNAGLKTVGCLWGFRDRETLEEADADYIVAKPEELLECLK